MYRSTFNQQFTPLIVLNSIWRGSMRGKCPYLEFFWSAFSCIRTRKIPNKETFHAMDLGNDSNKINTLNNPYSNDNLCNFE